MAAGLLRLLCLGIILHVSLCQDESPPFCCVVEKAAPTVFRMWCPKNPVKFEMEKKNANSNVTTVGCEVRVDDNKKLDFYSYTPTSEFYPAEQRFSMMIASKAFDGTKYDNIMATVFNGAEADAFEGSKVKTLVLEPIEDTKVQADFSSDMFRQTKPTIKNIKIHLDIGDNLSKLKLDEKLFRQASMLESLSIQSQAKFNCQHFRGLKKLKTLQFTAFSGYPNPSKCFFCGLTEATTKVCNGTGGGEDDTSFHNSVRSLSKTPMGYNDEGVRCAELNTTLAKSFSEANICQTAMCKEECKVPEPPAKTGGGGGDKQQPGTKESRKDKNKNGGKSASSVHCSGVLLIFLTVFAELLRKS